MIVARIYKSGSSPDDKVTGSCTIVGYRDVDPNGKGWFAANGFGFSFNAQEDSEANDSQPRANAGADTDKDKNKVFSAISISKEVDSTSSYLMRLAMEERKSKKGIDSGIQADLHVLSSVDIPNQKRFIYPGLMIHLEAVRVQDWEIQSSGDERPEETVRIKYDRAAMSYQRTPDGKNFSPSHTSGWDQTGNKIWSYMGFSKWIVTPTLSS
jgi:type VI protein secretion system component Hcp